MAEVTRASGPSSLSSKKLSSNNGFSFSSSSSSSKHIYDGVFASPPPPRNLRNSSAALCSFIDDDYAEMFGSLRATNNGGWHSSYSSIPVLDLPVSEERERARGARTVDYGGVFGGESFGLPLPDGEELFDQSTKKAKTSSATTPSFRSNGQTTEVAGPATTRTFHNGQAPSNDICQSFDTVKHSKHINYEKPTNASSGATSGVTRVAHGQAIPGSTYSLHEVGPPQKPQMSRGPISKDDTELSMEFSLAKKQGQHLRHTSLDLGTDKQKSMRGAGFQKVSGLGGSNPVAAHDTCQASTVVNPLKPDNDAKLEYDSKDDAKLAGPSDIATYKQNAGLGTGLREASDLSGSSSVLTAHDTCQAGTVAGPSKVVKDNVKLELGDEDGSQLAGPSDRGVNKQKSSDLTGSNSVATSCTTCHTDAVARLSKVDKDDTMLEFDAKIASPSDLGANKQSSELDASSQKASGLTASNSFTTSQASTEAGPSQVVREDTKVATGFNGGNKKGRHFRMTSLDLGDNKRACDENASFERKSRLRGSYSFDASHDSFAARVKVQPSKMMPSSSVRQFFPVESHYKMSENPSGKRFEDCLYRGAGGSPPSLDEQLDMNSAAAVSAAALQRAIEEAEMQIRLAKEFLEREGQGSTKLTFKDTLKVKVVKDDRDANEMYEFQQKKMHESFPLVDTVMRTFAHSERKSALKTAVETPQVAPVFEEQKNFSSDEESTEAESAKELKSSEECDKREGGEWEATKHLNQLITGVKNRIASFMAWQAETEKKEEPKEMEAGRKSLQKSEKGEGELKEFEVLEMKEAEKNVCATISDGKTKHEEDKLGFIPDVTEPWENEPTSSNMEQEKAGDEVDLIPDTQRSTTGNFTSFTSRSERLYDLRDPEQEVKKGVQENGDPDIKNREKVIDEVKDEWVQGEGEEAMQEGLHDTQGSTTESYLSFTFNSERLYDLPHAGQEAKKDVKENGDVDVENRRQEQVIDQVKDEWVEDEGEEAMQEVLHDNQSSTTENCLSFTFKSEKLYDLPEHEQEEKIDLQQSRELYMENRQQEQVIGEVKDDSLQVQDEDIVQEESHDTCMMEDCRESLVGSSTEEDDEMVEEPCSLAGHDRKQFTHEEDNYRRLNEEVGEEPIGNYYCENTFERNEKDGELENYEVLEEAEKLQENAQILEEANVMGEAGKRAEETEVTDGWPENDQDQGQTNHAEEVSGQYGGEENRVKQSQTNSTEETAEEVDEQASCISDDEEFEQTEDVFFSETEDAGQSDGSDPVVKEAESPDEESKRMTEGTSFSSIPKMDLENPVFSGEESEKMMEITESSSESKMDLDNPVLAPEVSELIEEERVLTPVSAENTVELDMTEDHLDDTNGDLQCENSVLHESEADMNFGERHIRGRAMESISEDMFEDLTNHLHDSGDTLNVEEVDSVSDQEAEKRDVEAVHRRRRWFENKEQVGASQRPSFLGGDGINLEVDQEVIEESDLAGSVEIHADKVECETKEVTTHGEADTALIQEDSRASVGATHKRRRWFVKRGEEGPEPPSLFRGIKVNLEMDHEIVNESLPHNLSDDSLDKLSSESGDTLNMAETDVTVNGEKDKQSVEAAPRRKRWFESGEKAGPAQQLRINEDAATTEEINQESEVRVDREKCGKNGNTSTLEEKDGINNKVESENEHHRGADEVKRRGKEKVKERLAVERAIREARERAFAEAKERARKDAMERPNQRGAPGAQDKAGKACAEGNSSSDKAAMEAKLRAERAAVERATAEARERALQRALSEKASQRSKEAGRYPAEKSSSLDPKCQSSSSYSRCSDSSNKGENFDGTSSESAQRCKARLERQKRTMERATKALEEKNKRDLLAQKEQAARNAFGDALDADVKRWSTGKEGNLRALLSTLQYILGPDSGWQAVSLTDLVAATAVRKAYKKATLCVHPDKLQQRGATIQQKYICEKVFDLLKEAWSKFNPDER